MKPLRLRARNLRTFPDLDLTLEHGLTGILGELRDAPEGADSNGAGKSTLLEAIDIALFGRRRSLAGYLTRGGDVDELMIELTFEHGNELYRVRRTFSARGRGKTSVDLERNNLRDEADERGERPDSWLPLTRASAKETDALVVETIGLSKETFRDSSYLRQGDGGYADPDRDARQRKELLVEAVLGRDPVWPRLADQAKQRRKAAQQRLERLAGETEQLLQQVGDATAAEYEAKQAEEGLAGAIGRVEIAEQGLAKIAARYQEARDQAARRQTLEAELATAQQTLAGLNRRVDQAAEAVLAIDTAREELATLPTSDQIVELEKAVNQLEAQQTAYRERQNALAEARAARDEAERIRREAAVNADKARWQTVSLRKAAAMKRADEHAVCQTCGQPVADEAKTRALGDLHRQADEWEAKSVEMDEVVGRQAALVAEGDVLLEQADRENVQPPAEFERMFGRLTEARAFVAQRGRLEERIVQLQRDVDQRPELDDVERVAAAVSVKQAALDELEPVDLTVIELAGQRARANHVDAQAVREQAVAAKARADERLTQTQAAEAKLAERAAETQALQANVDRDLLLEQAYGRDGIPALIIENTAIPYIETEASRILGLLGTSFQVELRTQAENKTGGLRDTLDVVVIDPDGNEADFADGCSGGEQTRVGLALRIALARLLAHRRGAESRLLALDEPSYLDQAGMAALLDVLRGLEDEFDVILLVSHVAELRDALDQTIVVVKENGRSSVDGIPVPVEAIAA